MEKVRDMVGTSLVCETRNNFDEAEVVREREKVGSRGAVPPLAGNESCVSVASQFSWNESDERHMFPVHMVGSSTQSIVPGIVLLPWLSFVFLFALPSVRLVRLLRSGDAL